MPVILMVVIGASGFYYLNQEDTLTNEQLKEEMEWSTAVEVENDGAQLTVEWNWPQLPEEGAYGTDYIGVEFPISEDDTLASGSLELYRGEEVIHEDSGTVVPNGIIFAYPTELDEYESYGTTGKIELFVPDSVASYDEITVSMLHTWTNHSELTLEDARFEAPKFGEATGVSHWVRTEPLSEEHVR